jgi:hypothetical protein
VGGCKSKKRVAKIRNAPAVFRQPDGAIASAANGKENDTLTFNGGPEDMPTQTV